MHIATSDGVMTVALSGEIDHHSAAFVRERIDKALITDKPHKLILDFSGVSFMDSSGVGLVMGRYKKTAATGCGLAVSGLSERDGRMMRMSGLQNLIEFR